MEDAILIQIQALKKELEHLKTDVDTARSRLMDMYLKAENTTPLPPNRNTLSDALSGIEREMEVQKGHLNQLETQTNDIYISPGATNETPEQMLERMKLKTQAADLLGTLSKGVQQVETAIGGLIKQAKDILKEVEQGNASQELAALKAKLGLGKKKLEE